MLLERASCVAKHASAGVTGCVVGVFVAEELVGRAPVARYRAVIAIGDEAFMALARCGKTPEDTISLIRITSTPGSSSVTSGLLTNTVANP